VDKDTKVSCTDCINWNELKEKLIGVELMIDNK